MPAKRPDYYLGGYYHFFNRGAHRISIFFEQDNYYFVLRKMKAYCRSLGLTVIAYSLLPNHYHWLIRQDGEQPAGLLPQRLFNSYSKAYNRRYDHTGTLFEGNYRAKIVSSEIYLLHLCRYIHANPVVHDLADRVEDWPYSNYLEWIGERQGTLVDREFVQAQFPRAGAYGEFVAAYLKERLDKGLEAYLREWEG
jgi:putative transposase